MDPVAVGIVSRVGRGTGEYYMEVVIVEGEGAVFGVNLSRPIVTNEDFATRLSQNYFLHFLFFI